MYLVALRHCTVLLIWRGARRRRHGLLPSAAKRRQAVLLQAGDGTFGCRLRPPGLLPLGLAPKKGAKETKPLEPLCEANAGTLSRPKFALHSLVTVSAQVIDGPSSNVLCVLGIFWRFAKEAQAQAASKREGSSPCTPSCH